MKARNEKVRRKAAPEEIDEEVDDDKTPDDPGDSSDIDDIDDIDPDDERWDAFIADDDERDPQPDHGDFWPED